MSRTPVDTAQTSYMRAAVDGADDASLFGSPPSSPRVGRSPSPGLALPSAETAVRLWNTQNVGTIALPGVPDSEHATNSLALSLSSARVTPVPRPPAKTSAVPHRAAMAKRAVGRPKKSKSKSKESTPSPAPEISLPDPSMPVPANFLRSQSALLGAAGVVAGIKPHQLPRPLGTSKSNPIVVDVCEAPSVDNGSSAHSWSSNVSNTSASRRGSSSEPKDGPKPRAYIPWYHAFLSQLDPSHLPVPSTKEIVSTLITQGDIFPVLAGILKLAENDSAVPASGNRHRSLSVVSDSSNPDSRPAKRRRLQKVPAGAEEWDVPFPFADGEGPDKYETKWHQNRGKNLILQLVKLIKDAAQRVSRKKYVLSLEEQLTVERCRRGAEDNPGIAGRRADIVSSGLGTVQESESLDTPQRQDEIFLPSNPEISEDVLNSLEQLVSSVFPPLNITNAQPSPSDVWNGLEAKSDSGAIQDWMHLFQDSVNSSGLTGQSEGNLIPDNAHLPGFEELAHIALHGLSGEPGMGVSGPQETNLNGSGFIMHSDTCVLTDGFDPSSLDSANRARLLGMTVAENPLRADDSASIPPHANRSSSGQQTSCGDALSTDIGTAASISAAPEPNYASTFIDQNIDPVLLAISVPAMIPSSSPPSLAASPLTASTSTFATPTPDPETPTISSTWDPIPYQPPSRNIQLHEKQDTYEEFGEALSKWKGKQKETESPTPKLDLLSKYPFVAKVISQVASATPTLIPPSSDVIPPLTSTDSEPGPSTSEPKSSFKARRQEAIRTAKEKRAQMAEERDKTHTKLWEVTIEHAILSRLAQSYSSSVNID